MWPAGALAKFIHPVKSILGLGLAADCKAWGAFRPSAGQALACANMQESAKVIVQAIPIRAAFKRAVIETGGVSSWNRIGVEPQLTIGFFKLILSFWLVAAER